MGQDFDNSKQETPCHCLSECSGLLYLTETSEGNLEREEPMALGSVTLLWVRGNYNSLFSYSSASGSTAFTSSSSSSIIPATSSLQDMQSVKLNPKFGVYIDLIVYSYVFL